MPAKHTTIFSRRYSHASSAGAGAVRSKTGVVVGGYVGGIVGASVGFAVGENATK